MQSVFVSGVMAKITNKEAMLALGSIASFMGSQ
jgi:hypothetical protein